MSLESQGQSEKGIGALLVQGGEIGAKGAEGFEAGLGAEATGDFLLDLGHTYGLFGGIVGEGNVVIGHEAPDLVGTSAQAVEEIEGLALLGLAPPARGGARGLAAAPSASISA